MDLFWNDPIYCLLSQWPRFCTVNDVFVIELKIKEDARLKQATMKTRLWGKSNKQQGNIINKVLMILQF